MKTKSISLDEAYKRATKGPLAADSDMIDVRDQAGMLLDNIGTEREWQAIGIEDGEGLAEVVALTHPINATLLVHCFNNMRVTVKALKRIQRLAKAGVLERRETGKPMWSFMDEVKKITASALSKANSVEVPES